MASGESPYARVKRRIWHTARFRELSGGARELFFYIMTCPHGNILGMFVLRPGYAMDDLQLTNRKQFTEPLHELLDKGLIKYDPKTEIVLDVEHFDKNPLENPNQVKAAISKLEELPKTILFQDLKLLVEQLGKPFTKPLIERLCQRLGEPVTVTGTVTVTVEPPKPPFEKPNNGFILPDWMPKEEWDGFVEMRKKIKKPLTDLAKKLTVNELERLKKAGNEPRAVLNQSIQRSWQGVFELKSQTGKESEIPWYERNLKQSSGT